MQKGDNMIDLNDAWQIRIRLRDLHIGDLFYCDDTNPFLPGVDPRVTENVGIITEMNEGEKLIGVRYFFDGYPYSALVSPYGSYLVPKEPALNNFLSGISSLDDKIKEAENSGDHDTKLEGAIYARKRDIVKDLIGFIKQDPEANQLASYTISIPRFLGSGLYVVEGYYGSDDLPKCLQGVETTCIKVPEQVLYNFLNTQVFPLPNLDAIPYDLHEKFPGSIPEGNKLKEYRVHEVPETAEHLVVSRVPLSIHFGRCGDSIV